MGTFHETLDVLWIVRTSRVFWSLPGETNEDVPMCPLYSLYSLILYHLPQMMVFNVGKQKFWNPKNWMFFFSNLELASLFVPCLFPCFQPWKSFGTKISRNNGTPRGIRMECTSGDTSARFTLCYGNVYIYIYFWCFFFNGFQWISRWNRFLVDMNFSWKQTWCILNFSSFPWGWKLDVGCFVRLSWTVSGCKKLGCWKWFHKLNMQKWEGPGCSVGWVSHFGIMNTDA